MMYIATLVALIATGAVAVEEGKIGMINIRGKAIPFVPEEPTGTNCSQVFYVSSSQEVEFSYSNETHGGLYCIIALRGPSEHKLVLMLMSVAGQINQCGQDAVRVYSINRGRLNYSAQLCNGSAPNIVTDENLALITFNSAQNTTSRAFRLIVQLIPNYEAPFTIRPTVPPQPEIHLHRPVYGYGSSSYDCDGQPWSFSASGFDNSWQEWGSSQQLHGNDLASWIARSNTGSQWSKKINP